MASYFTGRRAAIGVLATLPMIGNAALSFKNQVANNTAKNPLFIDFLLNNLPYSISNLPIGLFVIQNTEISKVVLNKLTELQQSLHTAYTQQSKEQLNMDLERLIKNDFLTFQTLNVKGVVISETEATLWALQYTNKAYK